MHVFVYLTVKLFFDTGAISDLKRSGRSMNGLTEFGAVLGQMAAILNNLFAVCSSLYH